MLIDLHTHTCRYSPCSDWTPVGMVEAAIASGLDGMVITEHETIWEEGEFKELQDRFPGFKLFRGVEASTNPEDHFLVYGVLDRRLFHRGMSTSRLLRLVADEGGFVALAHAYRYSDDLPPEIFEYPLDALEGMSSNIPGFLREKIADLGKRLNIPLIAGSDGHSGNTVGMFATEFEDDISDEKELVEALKAGRFRPYRHPEKTRTANEKTDEKLKLAKELLVKGYDLHEIQLRFAIPRTVIQGLLNGWDVHY